MAKITYKGRHTGGIFLPGDVFVGLGDTVEVDDALAAELVASGEFSAVKAPKSNPTAEEST